MQQGRRTIIIPYAALKSGETLQLIPAKKGYYIIIHNVKNGIIEYEYELEETNMSTPESEILNAVEQAAPNSVAVQAAEAVVETVADHSPLKIVSDLELAYTLYNEFKSKIAGLHPSVSNIFKALF